MTSATPKLVNGQILDAMQKKLSEALSQKRLSKKDRLQYEILELLVMFMADDHPKTSQMYAVFRPMAWTMLIIGSAFLAALATGRVIISFTP